MDEDSRGAITLQSLYTRLNGQNVCKTQNRLHEVSSRSIGVRLESLFEFQSDGRVARVVELIVHVSMSSHSTYTLLVVRRKQ